MVRTELLQGGKLIRTYSDTPGIGLLQTDTGIQYSEAVDLNPCPYVYEEIPMEQPEDPDQAEYEALIAAYESGVNDAE